MASERIHSPLTIRKRAVVHALSIVLGALLPVTKDPSLRQPSVFNTEHGSIITINTSKMCLLHQSAKLKANPGISSIPFFLRSTKDLDTVAIGRYIQRTMTPSRELAFHFLFSDEEVSMLINNQALTADTKPVTTAWTEFFMVICPLDVVAGTFTRGGANSLAYNLNTSVLTNAKCIAYLKEKSHADECIDRVARCCMQVGDYRQDIGCSNSSDSDAVCQLSMTHKSDFMDVLIDMFCQVTRAYGSESQAHGRVFRDELTSMNERAERAERAAALSNSPTDRAERVVAFLNSIATEKAAAERASALSSSPATKGTASAGESERAAALLRVRTLILRASLDQLDDVASSDAYATAAKLFFERMRKDAPAAADMSVAARSHGENVRGAIESYTTALTKDGFVCGMVNVYVDPAHEMLVILDTFLHPSMARKLYVLDAVCDTLRNLTKDEGVKRVVVLEPIHMNREIVLPLYDTLLRKLKVERAEGAPPPPTPPEAVAAASMTPERACRKRSYGTPVYAEWEI